MRSVVPLRRAHKRRAEELAFLRPRSRSWKRASPIGRAIGVTIILLFCARWPGLVGHDRHRAAATGKIVRAVAPSHPAFRDGVVRSIRVQTGSVKAGDVLIELDPTVNAAERDHLRNDLLAERLNIARLRAALGSGDDPVADFTPPDDADPSLISTSASFCLAR